MHPGMHVGESTSPAIDPSLIEKELCNLFPPEFLRETARKTGLVKRERKIDATILFWVLVLGFGVKLQRTLASLKRGYEKASRRDLSDSSWYYRFTPELVKFLRACVAHAMRDLARTTNMTMSNKLQGFLDLLIQDSTVVRLHPSLAKKWPATRARKVAAGVKVSMLISAVADGPKRIALTGERTHDVRTLRVGPWIKDRILLIDLGYFKYQLFTRVHEYGGFFVSRLKDNADPRIVALHRTCRGRSIDVVGKRLSDVLPRLQREVLDVEVEVSFRRRAYQGKRRGDEHRFRLVAVLNEETQEYHVYLTNIPVERLEAEDIAALYGARWEIELVFKELKSRYSFDAVDTENAQVVEVLIWVGILTLLASRRVYTTVRRNAPSEKLVRYTHLRWATVFAENADMQLAMILKYCGFTPGYETSMSVYSSQALDPHVNRERLMDPWRA